MTFIAAIAAKGHLPLANGTVCLALHLCVCVFHITVPLSLSFGTSEAAKGWERFRAKARCTISAPGSATQRGMGSKELM